MTTLLTLEFAKYIIAFVLAYIVSKIFSNKKLDKLLTKIDTLTDEIKLLTIKMGLVEELKDDIIQLEHRISILEADLEVFQKQCDKHHN